MTLEIGQQAPDFTLPADTGNSLSLKSLRGKKVVLFFYPKDSTPGCTKEACDFRNIWSQLRRVKAEVIGISKDSIESHQKFKKKHELPFILLSDKDNHVCEDYGVWIKKSFLGKKYMGIERSTFLINEQGIIEQIWRKVKVLGHADQIIKKLSGN